MKNRRLLLLAALLAAIVGLSLYLTPETRVERYVAAHRETLQADVDAHLLRGEPLRYDAPLETVNPWPGEHPMVEYVLPALRQDRETVAAELRQLHAQGVYPRKLWD